MKIPKKKKNMARCKTEIEESNILFIDAKKIKTIDQFLLVMSKNVPLMGTILTSMKAALKNGIFEDGENLHIEQLMHLTAFTLDALLGLCENLQKRATMDEADIIASFMNDQLNQANRIVEASKLKDPQSTMP